jgi:hypothetical protein
MPLESYATLINKRLIIPTQRTNYIAVETHFLVVALQKQVESIHFDENWYLTRYPDIQIAIHDGKIKTGHEHYVFHGFYEHRLPYNIIINEPWYIEQYEDIRRAVMNRDFESGQNHFEELGYREGRLPYPNFTLRGT